MTPPAAVVDTNVVVSGVLTSRPESPTVRILDGMLAGRFPFLLSVELIVEYRAVLLRPRIRARHKLKEPEIDEIVVELIANGQWRDIGPSPGTGPDRSDEHLWALLAKEPGSLLVTGDQQLIERPPQQVRVLSPRAFLELLDA